MRTVPELPELDGLRARLPAFRNADCPVDEDWINLALGTVSEGDEDRLLGHGITCVYCALRLKQAMDSRDAAEAKEVKAAPVEGEKSLVQSIRSGSDGRKNAVWLLVAAMLVLTTAMAWLVVRPDPQRTIADITASFQRGRPFEYRVSGVPWGPVDQLRGAVGRRVLPTPQGDQATQLAWAARAALWERDYEKAFHLLVKARARYGDSPDILNNLAVSEAAGGKTAEALRVLRAATTHYPDDPAILFNFTLLLIGDGRDSEAYPLLQKLQLLEKDQHWKAEVERFRR